MTDATEDSELHVDVGSVAVFRDGNEVVLEGRVPWLGPVVYAVHVGDGIRYVPLTRRHRRSSRSSSFEHQVAHTIFARSVTRNWPEEGCLSSSFRWMRNLGCGFCVLQLLASVACGLGPVSLTAAAITFGGVVLLSLTQWVVFMLTTRTFLAFYDLDSETRDLWNRVREALEALPEPVQAGLAKPTWDIKRNAGCDHAFTLIGVEPKASDPVIFSNTQALVWNTHLGVVMLMPDGVHRFDGRRTGVFPWSLVDVSVRQHEVPHARAPNPAPPKVRDGWLYSNKDGTPDLRYSGNVEVGIYRYTGLRFTDEGGDLDEVLLCADGEALRALRAAVVDYRRRAVAPAGGA